MDNLSIITLGMLKSGGGYSNDLIVSHGFLTTLEEYDAAAWSDWTVPKVSQPQKMKWTVTGK